MSNLQVRKRASARHSRRKISASARESQGKGGNASACRQAMQYANDGSEACLITEDAATIARGEGKIDNAWRSVSCAVVHCAILGIVMKTWPERRFQPAAWRVPAVRQSGPVRRMDRMAACITCEQAGFLQLQLKKISLCAFHR
ncbi:hypothetical protein [Paraburkholderia monticola]|uniref:hypothetical protein n=1 Tax=Paraburkholderia monticola TaxID=1399968 RepID=UPI0012905547|nr:hypothetical protein [Paraburkholderia monticola]